MRTKISFVVISVATVVLMSTITNGCLSFLKPKPGVSPTTQAFLHMRKKQYDQADTILATVKPEDPKYQDALIMRGRIANIKDDTQAAMGFSLEAKQTDPAKFKKEVNTYYNDVYRKYITKFHINMPDTPSIMHDASKNLIITQTVPNKFYAYDVKTKRAAWSESLESSASTHPVYHPSAFANGVVVAVSSHEGERALIALDANTGKRLWVQKVGYVRKYLGPASDGKLVYCGVGSGPYRIAAFDLKTGKPLWSFPLDHKPGPLTATTEGQVVFRTKTGVIYSLDSASGKERWQLALPAKFNMDKFLAHKDMLYFMTREETLYALDSSWTTFERPMERVRWKLRKEKDSLLAVPVVQDGQLIVPKRGAVAAYHPETGKVLWKTKLNFTTAQATYTGDPDYVLRVVAGTVGDRLYVKYNNGLVVLEKGGALVWAYLNDKIAGSYLVTTEPLPLNGNLMSVAHKTENGNAILALNPDPPQRY